MQGHDGMVSYMWLRGLDPIRDFNPLLQVASGVYLTLFGSFVFGTPGFPLSDVPLQQIAADARPVGSTSSQPGSSGAGTALHAPKQTPHQQICTSSDATAPTR
jgi:hypothetical protein